MTFSPFFEFNQLSLLNPLLKLVGLLGHFPLNIAVLNRLDHASYFIDTFYLLDNSVDEHRT